ncbi:hypothetical protein CP967_10275 [Streptomyces nitrosporeus]|uniref:Uncharacterized protein n=1 Tax=Streptomyces nitrosporeus TaxID=28894 RepID=A0A5J6FBG2_9ACTN|nr:hypothetical protein [Streptomyces nitrosporeus]QEU72320.1 hypothetical protein CP967_10275 [Streptomyces nitrosporeus]GGY78803.1 hypothetical protein GCM10010327_06430 [Streptomyces nitrosporeus]
MNVVVNSAQNSSAHPALGSAGHFDDRFALLTARAGLEPELAQRYTDDPASVLAEFGLTAAEPVFAGAASLDDHGMSGWDLVIDDLDRVSGPPADSPAIGTATWAHLVPGEAAEAAFA